MKVNVEIITKKELTEKIKEQKMKTKKNLKPIIFNEFSIFEKQIHYYSQNNYKFYKVLLTEFIQYWIVEKPLN